MILFFLFLSVQAWLTWLAGKPIEGYRWHWRVVCGAAIVGLVSLVLFLMLYRPGSAA